MSDERWLLIYYGRDEDAAGQFLVTSLPIGISCVAKLLKYGPGDSLITEGKPSEGVLAIYMSVPPAPGNMVAMIYRIDNLPTVKEVIGELPTVEPDKGRLH